MKTVDGIYLQTHRTAGESRGKCLPQRLSLCFAGSWLEDTIAKVNNAWLAFLTETFNSSLRMLEHIL